MNRAELEGLDREGLVVRAEASGVRRARILTRPELIDELLRRDAAVDPAELRRSRGFFGLARDLLSRVVERGLHLPDAVDRIRLAGSVPSSVPLVEPEAVPTLTLAEIYAVQGHKGRAVETLRRVLEREPDHAPAMALLLRLEDVAYVPPAPPLPPEPEEPRPVVEEADVSEEFARPTDIEDLERLSDPASTEEAEEVAFVAPLSPGEVAAGLEFAGDEQEPEDTEARVDDATDHGALGDDLGPEAGDAACWALPLSEGAMYVAWGLGQASGARVGRPVVRVVAIVPSWDGPEVHTRDLDIEAASPSGELVVRGLPGEAIVRVAVGIVEGDAFTSFAHSPVFRGAGAEGDEALAAWELETPSAAALPASIARICDRADRLRGDVGMAFS